MPDYGAPDFNVSFIPPASHAFGVTPHNTNELIHQTRGIYIGGAGNVTLVTVDGDTVTFVGMATGIIHPIRAKIIKASGTSATSIVGVW